MQTRSNGQGPVFFGLVMLATGGQAIAGIPLKGAVNSKGSRKVASDSKHMKHFEERDLQTRQKFSVGGLQPLLFSGYVYRNLTAQQNLFGSTHPIHSIHSAHSLQFAQLVQASQFFR